jgi:hypothetical protein
LKKIESILTEKWIHTTKPMFANQTQALSTMTAACVAHAKKNGWNLKMHIAGAKYYWKHETWWMEMVAFIMAYKVDTLAIQKWGLFDKMDVGILQVSPRAVMTSSSLDAGVLFKQHVIRCLSLERLT